MPQESTSAALYCDTDTPWAGRSSLHEVLSAGPGGAPVVGSAARYAAREEVAGVGEQVGRHEGAVAVAAARDARRVCHTARHHLLPAAKLPFLGF